MKPRKFMLHYQKPYNKNVVFGTICASISVIFIILLPQITQLFIDSVYGLSNTETPALGALWLWFVGKIDTISTSQVVLSLSVSFVVCLFLKNLFSLLLAQNFYRYASDACGDIRKDCFKKMAFADKNISTNELFFTCTNDINDYYDLVCTYIPKFITNLASILLVCIVSAFIHWAVLIGFVGFVSIILIVGFFSGKKINRYFHEVRGRKSNMLQTSEELVYQIREVKSFGNEDWAVEKYDRYNQSYSDVGKTSKDYIYKTTLFINLLKVLGIVSAVAFAGISAFRGHISIGYFVLIVAYAFTLFTSASALITNHYNAKVAFIGVSWLANFLSTKTSIKENKKLTLENPEIRFHNVKISLNGKDIFKNLNFRLPYGKHYMLQLSKGQGKTALSRILLRFLTHSEGKIYFNNIEYQNYNISSLRQQFSYVSQEPIIFEGTIAENISMFEKIDKTRLKKVIKICELSTVLKKLKNGVNQNIQEKGINLLTQDKQKICFARALYRNAPILLLDCPFNKFTGDVTEKLLKNLLKEYKNKSVILLTNTAKFASLFDEVIKLNKEGKK